MPEAQKWSMGTSRDKESMQTPNTDTGGQHEGVRVPGQESGLGRGTEYKPQTPFALSSAPCRSPQSVLHFQARR